MPTSRKPATEPLVALRLPDGTVIEVYPPRPSTPPPAAGARPSLVLVTSGVEVPRRAA